MQSESATAILLAGGTGSRMGDCTTPKQFLLVGEKPILVYAMEVFQASPFIDKLLIVVSDEWRKPVEIWAKKYRLHKLVGFTEPGATRQLSIYSALKALKIMLTAEAAIVIHDAVRPLLDPDLIKRVLAGLRTADGCMPALPVTDTTYLSHDGEYVSALLKRSALFSGQTPEAYRFGPYLKAHYDATEDELAAVHGSSELAFQHGLKVKIVAGSYDNRKLTVQSDFEFIKQALVLSGTKK